ncbi:unnamed protein product [Effrenium voratum]|uniref:Uncharacterized protein n=1 Tax=Effrenium voratum TaxID=2562239 RepID=A0AA36IDG7_9DINO|nr:unnamed protein product [Effrenium voratum]CAJ1419527.1 unnamed protein product [Effrenium voratum]
MADQVFRIAQTSLASFLEASTWLQLRVSSLQAKDLPSCHDVGLLLARSLCKDSHSSSSGFWRKLAFLRKFWERGGGNEKVIEALWGPLEGPDWRVRQAVLSVLPCALSGFKSCSKATVARVLQALQDESADVREAAVQTLPLLAEPGKEVVDALLSRILDRSTLVRRAVVIALPELSMPGDDAVIHAVLGRRLDVDPDVRRGALASLVKLWQLGRGCQGSGGLPQSLVEAVAKRISADPEEEVRVVAVVGLSTMGREGGVALRVLQELLVVASARDASAARQAAFAHLAPCAKAAFVQQGDAEQLASLRSIAGAVGQALKEEDPSLRRSAAECLRDLGHPSLLAAAEAGIRDRDKMVRSACLSAAARMRPSSKSKRLCISVALQCLADVSVTMRCEAAKVLQALGNTGDSSVDSLVVDALLGRLQDAPEVASGAAEALGFFADRSVSDALLERFHASSSLQMKCSVVRALSRLGNEADLTTLAADMKDFHEEVVLAFAQALGNGRRGDPAIIAALLRQVPLASAETLCEILKALSKVCSGGDSRATAAVMKIARESEESPVILEALKSLQHMVRRGDEQASGMLLKLLSHSQPLIRGAAAQSLGALGKKGDPTSVCALLRLLRSDEDVSNRVAAIQAVVQLAGVHGNCKRKRSDSTAICALAECMRDPLPELRRAAAAALPSLAQRGDPVAVAGVLFGLGHQDAAIRANVAAALPKVALPGDKAVIAALCHSLESDAAIVQAEAANALGELCQQAKGRAVEELQARLKDLDFRVRRAAMLALRRICGMKAVPMISHAIQAPAQKCRRSASWAACFVPS